MAPTSASDMVERELAKRREKRFQGSVWRLGSLALTRTHGQLTEHGRAFHALLPSESLSQFDRATERVTGRNVR